MKVSVVITVYNIESYVKECIDSVLNQTYRDIEVVVVNDYSPDGSMEIVRGYGDERIKIVTHAENMGAGWARRHGIEASTGDYVITVDGDDWLSEDFIEKLVIKAKETDADIVSGGITAVYADGRRELHVIPEVVSEGLQKFKDYENGKVVFLNNKIVRRAMYDTTPYCTRRYCEDTPVILPLLYYANRVAYVDAKGYYYRQRKDSLCHEVTKLEDALFKALCSVECHRFFLAKEDVYHSLISKAEFLEWLATIRKLITPEKAVEYKAEIEELMKGISNYNIV